MLLKVEGRPGVPATIPGCISEAPEGPQAMSPGPERALCLSDAFDSTVDDPRSPQTDPEGQETPKGSPDIRTWSCRQVWLRGRGFAWLVVQVVPFSLVMLAPLVVVLWLPSCLPWERPWQVDTGAREVVVVPRPPFLLHELGRLPTVLGFQCCLCLMFLAYAPLPPRRSLAVLLTVYALAMAQKAVLWAQLLSATVFWGGAVAYASVVPWGLWIVPYRLLAPRDSQVPVHAVRQLLALCVCMGTFYLLYGIPATSTLPRLAVVVVLYPLLKEVTLLLCRPTGCVLMYGGATAGARGRARHALAPVFVLWAQFGFAIGLRLFLVRIPNEVLPLVLVGAAVQEVAGRLTVRRRDREVARLQRWLRARRLWCGCGSVAETDARLEEECASPSQSPTVCQASTLPSRYLETAERRASVSAFAPQFFAYTLLNDAVCEYSAIAAAHLLPILFHDRPLQTPLDYFLADRFASSRVFDFGSVLYSLLLQVAMEVAVDALCFTALSFQGYDFHGTWKAVHKRGHVCALFLAGWMISAWINVALHYEFLGPCLQRDLCYCAGGHGLKAGGLRERYCVYLYPANTTNVTGMPPLL